MTDVHPVARQFLNAKAAAGRSRETVQDYEKHFRSLARHFGFELPSSAEDVEAWIAQCTSPTTSRNRLVAIRALLKWAHRRRLVAGPLEWLDHVERPAKGRARLRTFTPGELAALARESSKDPIDFALFCVLLDTGIRIGEAASLRPSTIRPHEIDVDGKTGRHTVPISPETRKALLTIAGGNRVWPGRLGKPMTTDGLQWRARRLIARAGIEVPAAGPHTFRHTFATSYLAKGGEIKRLSMILGHASVRTTEIYLHLDTSYLHTSFRQLSPLADALAPARLLPGLENTA